ncbi:hypothetical protein [Hyalangium gracile]|uniref:hypothetical protein n=1 Tax=Hyalangium gracile TaxID=394092 RepID=UPI001CCA5945|nr:hypothetical protein [Hyalangium gracile]
MPSFLHGTLMNVARKTRKEGHRCGEQYRKDGTFPTPREMLEVSPGDVVIAHEVVDFQHEQPAWRLYMLSGVMRGVNEAMEYQHAFQVRDAYEDFCRETAWGALHCAIEPNGPVSCARTAVRLQAVLPFWEPLESVRYLFKKLDTEVTLEALLMASNDWAMDAWCPVSEGSVRTRLQMAADRMARATRDDCIEAILRQMPRALEFARGLKHRDLLADPSFQHQRLTLLTPEAFERLSAARTSDLLGQVYAWDRQLAQQ